MDAVNPHAYRTLVFDCDGVILDSNRLKTQAFKRIAAPFGDDIATSFVDFHLRNAGASRYRKFEYLLRDLLGEEPDAGRVARLAVQFANAIADGLLACKVASGLQLLREKLFQSAWMVVSGSDQTELRSLFDRRHLSHYFDAGVFGSPDTKDIILGRGLTAGTIMLPALYVGDSRYDYEAATRAGLDFVFASDWTEFVEWRSFVAKHGIATIGRLGDLVV